jgi:hypothetical protein
MTSWRVRAALFRAKEPTVKPSVAEFIGGLPGQFVGVEFGLPGQQPQQGRATAPDNLGDTLRSSSSTDRCWTIRTVLAAVYWRHWTIGTALATAATGSSTGSTTRRGRSRS